MTEEQKDLTLSSALGNYETKEVDFECEKHGTVKTTTYCFNGTWRDPSCPECAEEERKAEEEAEAKRKQEKLAENKRRLIENRLKGAMIPKRFQQHSFDTFVTDTPERQKKKESCLNYANNFPEAFEKGRCMIFCGTTGTGKTHLSCSIANHVIREHQKSAVFMRVLDAVRMVKETYNRDSERSERDAIAWFNTPDLLILDEVGVQFGSDAEKMILDEILNNRYEDMKPTILISNLDPEGLKRFVGDRILDRFRENGGKMLQFKFKSYRSA
jgi:DNA replication protein DnaC